MFVHQQDDHIRDHKTLSEQICKAGAGDGSKWKVCRVTRPRQACDDPEVCSLLLNCKEPLRSAQFGLSLS